MPIRHHICRRGVETSPVLRERGRAASVSKAALEVNICQPALSRQIRDLETELGVRLFDRIGRRIQLTAEGEDLLRRSREILAQAASLVERAKTLVGGITGVLRVGATPQTMQSVMAGFLPGFQRAHPGVDVRLTEEGGVRLHELVERGELHLALGGILTGSRLESRPLFPIRVLAVTASRPRWKGRTTVDVTELASEPLLLLSRDFGSRQLFDAACRIVRASTSCRARESRAAFSDYPRRSRPGRRGGAVDGPFRVAEDPDHAVASRREITRRLGRPGVGSAAFVACVRDDLHGGPGSLHFPHVARKAFRQDRSASPLPPQTTGAV